MLDDGSAGDILKNPLRISSPLRPSGRAAERSGYRAPGAVRGSRLINTRSISRRGIAGRTRVQIGTGGRVRGQDMGNKTWPTHR